MFYGHGEMIAMIKTDAEYESSKEALKIVKRAYEALKKKCESGEFPNKKLFPLIAEPYVDYIEKITNELKVYRQSKVQLRRK